jgi:hypothetical protein
LYFIFNLESNLVKSSYGWLPLWLHWKITSKDIVICCYVFHFFSQINIRFSCLKKKNWFLEITKKYGPTMYIVLWIIRQCVLSKHFCIFLKSGKNLKHKDVEVSFKLKCMKKSWKCFCTFFICFQLVKKPPIHLWLI